MSSKLVMLYASSLNIPQTSVYWLKHDVRVWLNAGACLFAAVMGKMWSASRPSAVPPRWRWEWHCRGPWWLWHSGWSLPPAADRGRRCTPGSYPGPHPQKRGLVLSLPSLRSVRISLGLCYHPDRLSVGEETEREVNCCLPESPLYWAGWKNNGL